MPAYRTVIFDCDSTLSAIEGIDELAAACGEDVSGLTEAAMRGDLPLEAVYGRRLAMVRPSRAQVDALARQYVARLVPDARGVIGALLQAGVDVRIVSGGLRPAVLAVARALGIGPDAVAAVDIFFDDNGHYSGYDVGSPLARAGGKCTVVESWRDLRRPSMMVGDGSTDLEVRPVVDVFVAYAGVIVRDNVLRAADVVIRSASLAPVLALALGDAAPPGMDARMLFERGSAILASAVKP